MRRHEPTGFTIIELLVVVSVIGILSAIAIPTLLNGIDRAKQKRTMVDIRSVGLAVGTYAVDQNTYPFSSNVTQLAAAVEPIYIRKLPLADGWHNALIYVVDPSGLVYTLGSPGKDGGTSLAMAGSGGPTRHYDDDIIYSNGEFLQWPEGLQE